MDSEEIYQDKMFSPQKLVEYKKEYGLNDEKLAAFAKLSDLDKVQMQELLQDDLTDKEFKAIKNSGISGAALLKPNAVSWELACLVSGKKYSNLMIENGKNESVMSCLSFSVREVIKSYISTLEELKDGKYR